MSGSIVPQTAGHADHRFQSEAAIEMGGAQNITVASGDSSIAEGVSEVVRAVLEKLRREAAQLRSDRFTPFGPMRTRTVTATRWRTSQ